MMIAHNQPPQGQAADLGRCPRCQLPWGEGPFCQRDGTLRQSSTPLGDRYLLERQIGSGGMGFVYAARHRLLGKAVAIKVLRPEICSDAEQVQRFLREAQLCSQLQHENIVNVTDFGRDPRGNIYLSMDLLQGQTLEDLLAGGQPLPTRRALGILRQLCRALDSAHRLGIIHRDLKPRNIFLTEASGARELVKLLDFGISRMASGQDRVTSTGIPVGTTPYMPPEQLRGDAVQDQRADIYALGVITYQMLTAKLPFGSTGQAQLIAEKLLGRPISLSDSAIHSTAPAIALLIEECLAADPNRRPAGASEVEQRLFSGINPSLDNNEDLTGMRAGSYRLVQPLGSGAIGAVWLGEHPVIGSKVAIKILHPELSETDEVVRRFVVEAQAVNRIQSPHIVKTFDFGKLPDGRDYAVMELLSGETLADKLERETRLSWADARPLLLQIVQGLGDAHRCGIVHRDLKPANIHLEHGSEGVKVRLLDFGIAKLLDSDVAASCQTRLGVTIGTPLYAAPEQVEGKPISTPADIYALGVVLYEMLDGEPPFSGTIQQVMSAKLAWQAPSLGERRPELPPELVGLVSSMLQRDPALRPATEQLFASLSALQAASPGQPSFDEAETLLPAADTSLAAATPLPLDRSSGAPPVAAPMPAAVDTLDVLPRASATRRWLIAAAAVLLIGLPAAWFGLLQREPEDRPTRLAAVQDQAAPDEADRRQPTAPASARAAAADKRALRVPAAAAKQSPDAGPAVAKATPRVPPAQAAKNLPAASSEGRQTPQQPAVWLRTTPSGALVMVAGRAVGRTPIKLRLDPRLHGVTVSLSKQGYQPATLELDSQSPSSLNLKLKPQAAERWADPFSDSPKTQKPAPRPAPKRRPGKLLSPFEE